MSYGTVGAYEHTVYIRSGVSDGRRQRNRVAAAIVGMATLATVAILAQTSSEVPLTQLLGRASVSEFARTTGLSERSAFTMLEQLDTVRGGVVSTGGDINIDANLLKADNYLNGDDAVAKLVEHIKGGSVTPENAEVMFDSGAEIKSTNLCLKRDVINEKLMNLMNRLRAEVKPANATIVALADTWIEAQEAYLLAATNYQDAKQDRTDACTAVQGSINDQQEADDAANQATTTKKNVYATVEEELKAISSEKAMIEMLLKMLGTLHDINKQHEGIAIGSDSIGKDGNGVSNEYQRQFETKASPAQLEETLNKVKKMSLRIKSPGIASKLAALPTTMLAVYKESSEVSRILIEIWNQLDMRASMLEDEKTDADNNEDQKLEEKTNADITLVTTGKECEQAQQDVMTYNDQRATLEGKATAARSDYVAGRASYQDTIAHLSREVFIIRQILLKLNNACEGKPDTSVDVGQGQYRDQVDQNVGAMIGNINAGANPTPAGQLSKELTAPSTSVGV